jgi:hypothetical protein
MENTIKTGWWRWPAMPLAAIVAAAMAGGLMHGIQWLSIMFTWGSSEGWYLRYIVPLFVSGAAGYAFALASCAVAPRGKRLAGTVMVTLLGVVCVVGAVGSWLMNQYTTAFAVLSTVSAVVMLEAAIAGVSQADV